MPSPTVVSERDVVNSFVNLETELRGLIRRQLQRTPHREEGDRIAEEIVTLVRARLDNAPSINFWWSQMQGADLCAVPLNSLYERLKDLKVDVEKVLRAIARKYEWLTSSLLIIDDTSAQKFGLWMQGVSNVHVANIKGGVMGHNIVTLMLASPRGALFIDHQVKVNPSKPRLARHPGAPIREVRVAQRTKKWEMALDLLRQARAKGVDAALVLFDCAYFNAGCEVPKRLTKGKVTFITKAKKNDKFIVHGVEMTSKEYHDMCLSWKSVGQTDHRFYQREATLKDGTVVKLVATWFFRGRSMKQTRTVLVTNGLDISGSKVVLTYLRRWEIERGYQDLKRSMGGMAYHSTDFHHMRNFIWTGFLAYALARRAKQQLGTKLGLPTLLAVRRRAVRSMIGSGETPRQGPETLIPTGKIRPHDMGTMAASAS
jgi:SRSO17 transposase